MGDRYRKYVDKRAIKMPMKIGSGMSGSVSSVTGRKLREITTDTEHLDLLLVPILVLTSYFKQKTATAFQLEKQSPFFCYVYKKYKVA